MLVTAEKLVADYLQPRMKPPVYVKVPPSRPEVFVRVDSGVPKSQTLVTYETTIIIQAYAKSVSTALEALEQAQKLMRTIDQETMVYDWEETAGPYDYPDPDIAASVVRWQIVGELTHEKP